MAAQTPKCLVKDERVEGKVVKRSEIKERLKDMYLKSHWRITGVAVATSLRNNSSNKDKMESFGINLE